MQKFSIEADIEIVQPLAHSTLPLAVSLDGIGHCNDIKFTTDPNQNVNGIGRKFCLICAAE